MNAFGCMKNNLKIENMWYVKTAFNEERTNYFLIKYAIFKRLTEQHLKIIINY